MERASSSGDASEFLAAFLRAATVDRHLDPEAVPALYALVPQLTDDAVIKVFGRMYEHVVTDLQSLRAEDTAAAGPHARAIVDTLVDRLSVVMEQRNLEPTRADPEALRAEEEAQAARAAAEEAATQAMVYRSGIVPRKCTSCSVKWAFEGGLCRGCTTGGATAPPAPPPPPPPAAKPEDPYLAAAGGEALVWLRGECGSGLTGSDASLVALRTRVPLYCGDWQLWIAAAPKAACASWEAFAALSDAPGDYGASQSTEHNGRRAADVVFDATNFGTLYWNWADRSGVGGVYGRDANGNDFLPRIFVPLAEDAGVDAVEEARQDAQASLAEMPAELAGGLPKGGFAALIDEDMAMLRALVADKGTFGHAVLGPDALEPITATLYADDDGNRREAAFATERWWFYVRMDTS